MKAAFNVALFAPDSTSSSKNIVEIKFLEILRRVVYEVNDLLLSDWPGAEFLSKQPEFRLIGRMHNRLEATLAEQASAESWNVISLGREDEQASGLDDFEPLRCDALIAQSDVLIIVDLEPKSCQRAWLTRAASEQTLLTLSLSSSEIYASHGGDWRTALRNEVGRLLLLNWSGSGSKHRREAEQSIQEMRLFLERSKKAPRVYYVYRVIESLLAFENSRHTRASLPMPSDIERDQDGASVFNIVTAALAPHLERADALAVAYAATYRSAVVFRVMLTVTAISGLFLAFYVPNLFRTFGSASEPLLVIKSVHRLGFLIELVSILGIIALAGASNYGSWHRRFATYRFTAEGLRQMPLRAAAGDAYLRRTNLCLPTSEDWPAWYLRAIARDIVPTPFAVTTSQLSANKASVRKFIAGQISFFASTARKFELISRRLEMAALAFYWLGVAAVFLRFMASIYLMENSASELLLSLGCLVFPSLAPCFIVFRSYGEYPRLAERFRTLAASLQPLSDGIFERDQSPLDLVSSWRLVVAMLQDETKDWSDLIARQSISRI